MRKTGFAIVSSKVRWLMVLLFIITMFVLPQRANAFECQKHIALAQGAINELEELMESMTEVMPARDIRFVHRLIDDAKLFVAGAKHGHDEALGYHDHVRAVIMAHHARGHVIAATLLHDEFMKELARR